MSMTNINHEIGRGEVFKLEKFSKRKKNYFFLVERENYAYYALFAEKIITILNSKRPHIPTRHLFQYPFPFLPYYPTFQLTN